MFSFGHNAFEKLKNTNNLINTILNLIGDNLEGNGAKGGKMKTEKEKNRKRKSTAATICIF